MAGLGRRWHIGQRRHASVAGDCKSTRIPVLYQANNVRQELKSDGNLAGDEVGRIARNIPVGDVDELRPGELFEIGAGQML